MPAVQRLHPRPAPGQRHQKPHLGLAIHGLAVAIEKAAAVEQGGEGGRWGAGKSGNEAPLLLEAPGCAGLGVIELSSLIPGRGGEQHTAAPAALPPPPPHTPLPHRPYSLRCAEHDARMDQRPAAAVGQAVSRPHRHKPGVAAHRSVLAAHDGRPRLRQQLPASIRMCGRHDGRAVQWHGGIPRRLAAARAAQARPTTPELRGVGRRCQPQEQGQQQQKGGPHGECGGAVVAVPPLAVGRRAEDGGPFTEFGAASEHEPAKPAGPAGRKRLALRARLGGSGRLQGAQRPAGRWQGSQLAFPSQN